MCVDAGYATQDVYGWVRQHPQAGWGPAGSVARQPRTAVAVKGRDRDTALLLSVSQADAGSRRRGLRVWSVGTPVAKGELYRWLKLEWLTEDAIADGAGYPPGACHFPQYGDEYFKQLTAERLVTRIVKGFPRTSWEKEPGRRNEALDCRVYARAAAAIYGMIAGPKHIGASSNATSDGRNRPWPPPGRAARTAVSSVTPADPAPVGSSTGVRAGSAAAGTDHGWNAEQKGMAVRGIAYDPWNATHIALRLQDEGATMVEFRQGFRSMAHRPASWRS